VGIQHPVHQEKLQEIDLTSRPFVVGDGVTCAVWELLSLYDKEGIIKDIDGNYYVVEFETKTIRVTEKGLKKL
tara:strand:- start:492 stop:710 length:219 start_codon:yes stop_codon:yes gene_type:complete